MLSGQHQHQCTDATSRATGLTDVSAISLVDRHVILLIAPMTSAAASVQPVQLNFL